MFSAPPVFIYLYIYFFVLASCCCSCCCCCCCCCCRRVVAFCMTYLPLLLFCLFVSAGGGLCNNRTPHLAGCWAAGCWRPENNNNNNNVNNLIRYKGFQVAPAELEGLICTHPAVQDVTVIPRVRLCVRACVRLCVLACVRARNRVLGATMVCGCCQPTTAAQCFLPAHAPAAFCCTRKH